MDDAFFCPRSLSLGRSLAAFRLIPWRPRARKRDAEPGPESGWAHYTPPGKIFHLENTSEGDFRHQHVFPRPPRIGASGLLSLISYYIILLLCGSSRTCKGGFETRPYSNSPPRVRP